MFKRLRTLFIVGIVVIIAAAVLRGRLMAPSASTAAATANVQETTTADQGDIVISVSATGQLQANQNVSLSFPISGKVVAINVTKGDHVRKGQTIAVLDAQIYSDAIMLSQARLLQQQAALSNLMAKPRQVDIDVDQALINLGSAKLTASNVGADPLQVQIDKLNVGLAQNQLWQTQLQRDASDKTKNDDTNVDARKYAAVAGLPFDSQNNANINSQSFNVAISQANLESDQSQTGNVSSYASAQASLTSAQNSLNKLMRGPDAEQVTQAQANVQSAQSAVDLAKANLDKTKLLAPFDGVISDLNVHLGEPLPAGPAAVILDTSSFYVDLPIDEADISEVEVGQATQLTFDALPGVTLAGKVIRVADTATQSGDTVTYTVQVALDPAAEPLLSTMSATAAITTDQITNVVRIRNRFVRVDRTANKYYANVRQPDGTYKEVELTLGLRNDTYSEVKSGLKTGDSIALIRSNALPSNSPSNNPTGPGIDQ